MIVASIPADLRAVIAEHVTVWKPTALHVPWSGQFVTERAALAVDPKIQVHSADTLLTTSAIGAWLTGRPVPVAVNPESEDRLGFLLPHLDDGIGTVAAVMLAGRFMPAVSKQGNRYYDRLLAGWADQFPQLHGRMVEKLREVTLPLATYTATDAASFVGTVPGDSALIAFPRLDNGAANAERATLEHLLWDAPEPDDLDDDDMARLLDRITDRDRWMIATATPLPDLEEYRRAEVKTSPRARATHVYSSLGRHRHVRARQTIRPVMAPRLGPDQEIGDTLSLVRLDGPQIDGLRAKYLDRRIAPGSVNFGVGVLVDGHLVGCYAFRDAVASFDPECAYLMADFAIRPTRYKNLAKLVLCAAVSNESKLLIERVMNRRLRRTSTTAFADRPVSMKYRNLFRLDGRRDADDGVHRYVLNYSSELGRWPLADAYAMWQERWSQTR